MKLNTNLETQYGKVNFVIEMSCEEMIKSVELTKDLLNFVQQNPVLLGAIAGAVQAFDQATTTQEIVATKPMGV